MRLKLCRSLVPLLSIALTGIAVTPVDTVAAEPSPLEGRIAFVSNRDGDFDVYIKNVGGGGLEKVTFNDKDEYEAKWSPDGKWLVFERDVTYWNTEIFIKKVGGGPAKRMTRSRYIFEGDPTWSPDGEWILFSADTTDGGDLVALKVETSESIVVAAADENSLMEEGTWAPSGGQIAFVEYYDGSNIFLTTFPDYSERQQLTGDWSTEERNLDWSPDGSRILYARGLDDVGWDLYVLDPVTAQETPLIDDMSMNVLPGSWSPDGSMVAFYSDPAGLFDIYVTDLETGELIQVTTHKASDRHPDWTDQ